MQWTQRDGLMIFSRKSAVKDSVNHSFISVSNNNDREESYSSLLPRSKSLPTITFIGISLWHLSINLYIYLSSNAVLLVLGNGNQHFGSFGSWHLINSLSPSNRLLNVVIVTLYLPVLCCRLKNESNRVQGLLGFTRCGWSKRALFFFPSFSSSSLFLYSGVEDLKIGLQQPVAFISTWSATLYASNWRKPVWSEPPAGDGNLPGASAALSLAHWLISPAAECFVWGVLHLECTELVQGFVSHSVSPCMDTYIHLSMYVCICVGAVFLQTRHTHTQSHDVDLQTKCYLQTGVLRLLIIK